MKSFKTLVLAKSIAAAVVATAGIAAPAISHASPDDGMVCRVSYGAQFANNNLKCTKTSNDTAPLQCLRAGFPNKVIRVRTTDGNSDGRDLCARPGVVITSNGSLNGLTLNQDYSFAEVNPSRLAAVREARERNEETSLGVAAGEVDAHSSQATVSLDGGVGGEDQARFSVTLFTFAIPATFNISLPPQLIQPIQPVVTLPAPRLP